jgi:hypothetical protein
VRAFEYFAEGVLYDPRRPQDPVHVMDGVPVPVGYPVWHAYARAMMLLGIDTRHWREVLPVIAFGCALQLKAKPNLTKVNPPLPPSVVRKTAAETLPLNTRQLDVFYQTFPYPPFTPQSAAAAASRFSRKTGR